MKFVFTIVLSMISILSIAQERVIAPEFTLKDIDGNEVKLSDFKGKVVYLDIWATWCRPCLQQMKYGKAVKKHYHESNDVVFININVDRGSETWRNYVTKKNIGGVNLYSQGGNEQEIGIRYKANAIPKFIIIDKNGRIATEEARWPQEYEALIKQIDEIVAE